MDDDTPAWPEGPPLACSRLLACQNVWFDYSDPDSGWLIERVVVHIRLADNNPAILPKMCLFAQFHGTAGEYFLRVRLVRIGQDEDGETVELAEVAEYGPLGIEIPGENYVECHAFRMSDVPLLEAGVYEFQLWADGIDDMLMNERIEVRR